MKPYELTPFQLSQLKGNEWVDGRWYYDPYEVAREAQKKLLKWLAGNDLLAHPPFTPTKPCVLCQLLKDFGIGGKC